MNIKEVYKHIKVDLILSTLIYVFIGVILIITLICIFTFPVKALITNDITNSIGTTSDCTITGSTELGYYCSADDSVSNDLWAKVQVGNHTASDNVRAISFKVNTGVSANMNVTIQLKGQRFNNLNYSCYNSIVSCSITYVSTNQLNLNFSTSTARSGMEFTVTAPNNSTFNGYNLFYLNQFVLLQNEISSGGGGGSSSFDDSGIINNQNSNTQEIIDNNNSNTESINTNIWEVGNQIWSTMINLCKNYLNLNKIQKGVLCNGQGTFCASNPNNTMTIDTLNGKLTYSSASAWNGWISDFIPVDWGPDNALYLMTNLTYSNVLVKIASYDGNKQFIQYGYQYYDSGVSSISLKLCSNSNVSVCNNIDTKYIRFSIESRSANSSIQYSNLRVVPNTNTSYCPFGTSKGNKLDDIGAGIGAIQGGITASNTILEDIKDIQQDTYNWLTDESEAEVDTDALDDTLGLVSVSNPLSYLLTLPLNLLNKINSALNGSCQDYEIGAFDDIGEVELSNYTFKFTCIRPQQYLGQGLWTIIDIIMGTGLLVITISKFYHAITNILSMGANDEVEKRFKYLSPMEFLTSIIGNAGFGGVVNSVRGGN